MVVVGCVTINKKHQGITFLMKRKRSTEAPKVEISNFFLEPLRSKKRGILFMAQGY